VRVVEVQGTAEGVVHTRQRWTHCCNWLSKEHCRAGDCKTGLWINSNSGNKCAWTRSFFDCWADFDYHRHENRSGVNNAGKLAELQAMLQPLGVALIRQADLAHPRLPTFVENAGQGASRVHLSDTALADDAACVAFNWPAGRGHATRSLVAR
jgi:hypothetical protein